MKKAIIEAGDVFNDWTVLSEFIQEGKDRRFLCRCVCGKEKLCFLHHLKAGVTRGCGCRRNNDNRKRETSHGMSYSKEYASWRAMLWRCSKKCTNDLNKNYHGRGISVCERWKSFKNFIQDMGNKPSPDQEIDRIDNEKNYSLENCRWATSKQNSRNKRNNFIIERNGEEKCLSEWCEVYNLTYGRIYYRMKKFGMSLDEAIKATT